MTKNVITTHHASLLRSLITLIYSVLIAWFLLSLTGPIFSVLVISGSVVVCFFLLAFESRSSTRLPFIWLCIIFSSFFLAEGYALIHIKIKNTLDSNITYNQSTRVYWDTDAALGYAPQGPREVDASKSNATGRVYEARYTINEHSLRQTQSYAGGDCSFWFFGGSFTFGEGLNDNETLPYYFSRALDSRHQVINFGFHGYGPHQMLKNIRSGQADKASANPPSRSFYIWIPNHVWRASGLTPWNIYGPRYIASPGSTLQQYGNFNWPFPYSIINNIDASFFLGLLRNSALFRLFYGYPRQELSDNLETAIQRLVDIITAAKQELKSRYNSSLIVIIWPDKSQLSFDTIKAMRNHEITILDKKDLLDGKWDDRYLIAGDGHPSAQANNEVALSLARRYGQCDKTNRKHTP